MTSAAGFSVKRTLSLPAEISQAFLDYFKCPGQVRLGRAPGNLSQDAHYFNFGDATCFGRHTTTASLNGAPRRDLSDLVTGGPGGVRLPFDLDEVVANLRQERYLRTSPHYLERLTAGRIVRDLYYSVRPALPPSVRRHLQRVRLSGWNSISFPRWPVDVTVERLMQNAMAALLKHRERARIPFIWFWPAGARGCTIVTHDVEGPAGREFCGELMDLDDSFGIKSAFQIIPGIRSHRLGDLLGVLRGRGFEVNLHDLNHDCYLFQDRQQFLERVAEINRYAREFDCRGFRSAAMYREQEWYGAFEFSYDMSVPNVAHLEPQRGGCCTVMPYFVGDVLELPLTTAQDYSLFHILGDYSTALWREQIERILSEYGLVTILTHPDYLVAPKARAVYVELLAHLRRLRERGDVWFTLPSEVDTWWRERSQMSLVRDGESWRIEGPGSERAVLAYAGLDGDRVVYSFDEVAAGVA